MDPIERVERALRHAGDPAGALLFRQIVRTLDGPPRLAVTALDPSLLQRWEAPASVSVVPLRLPLGLAGHDQLLSSHAVVFLSSLTAPLGQREREALLELRDAGSPRNRWLILIDADLLDALSDHPERERAAITARARALLPAGWALLDGPFPSLESEHLRDRPLEVGRILLANRLDALRRELSDTIRIIDTLTEEQRSARNARDRELRDARRRAAHTLGVIRRATERLEMDLGHFLLELEAQLGEQIEGVEDVELARRTLVPWLSHVVERWIDRRIQRWKEEVHRELQELELEDPVGLALVVPALHGPPVPGERDWRDRLGTTAAIGSAAALAVMGMWIPGLLALVGGLALSTALREPPEEDHQRLVRAGRLALRQLGEDASGLLRAQIDELANRIKTLVPAATTDHAPPPALRGVMAARATLEEQIHALNNTLAQLGESP